MGMYEIIHIIVHHWRSRDRPELSIIGLADNTVFVNHRAYPWCQSEPCAGYYSSTCAALAMQETKEGHAELQGHECLSPFCTFKAERSWRSWDLLVSREVRDCHVRESFSPLLGLPRPFSSTKPGFIARMQNDVTRPREVDAGRRKEIMPMHPDQCRIDGELRSQEECSASQRFESIPANLGQDGTHYSVFRLDAIDEPQHYRS
ncbi:hypothetical protein CIHG_01810 [Coccidioides immitis H538.4]|uniref:Uncharacterized protein n=3 Tax=Coccidioides immitis TaxID=5501 RepID=A0A0J8R5G2_COCIT|nr:hypothetical protein CIRG_06131 [Coccidioides immitis RMSCC 2394]KMU80339.1 hypothetical protein CISG_02190 [Coccidioides immitis RMSCC 3703]KMU84026.1 hypothetical protein CIHG_01810 [Coccidioides immitis H538.4]